MAAINKYGAIFIVGFFVLSLGGKARGFGKTELPPMKDSAAYQQFCTKPVTELSKLVYLIDRFGASDIQVVYDNYHYNAKFCAVVARWLLSMRYHQETAEQFIIRWCNTSFPGGNLIWVKYPDGDYRLARDILKEELRLLESTVKPQPAASSAA